MNKLFNNFKGVNLEQWKEKVITDLKGSDYNEKLVTQVEEIEIQPIYNSESISETPSVNSPSDWISFQLVDGTDAKTANKKALEALNNDISGLYFSNPNNLEVLLENISVEHIKLKFTNYSEEFLTEWEEFRTNAHPGDLAYRHP